MPTDTSEKGLETLIVRHLTGTDGLAVDAGTAAEQTPSYGGIGYHTGSPKDYDRSHAIDVPLLFPEPLLHNQAACLQPGPEQAGAGSLLVHQWPASGYFRTQEQSDQADCGRRGGAVQAGPGSPGKAI